MNMRTTIKAKNNRVYVEREFRTGEDSWVLSTRLGASSVAEAVKRLPVGWRGSPENEIHAIEEVGE